MNFNKLEWSFLISFFLVSCLKDIFSCIWEVLYIFIPIVTFSQEIAISVYHDEQYLFYFLCESWFILHLYRFWNIVYLYQTHYDLICLLWKLASHQYCTWLYLFVINLIISVQLCLWHVYFSIECTLWWKLSECLLSVSYNSLAHLRWSPFVCLSFFISLKLLNNVNQTWHTASLGERLSSLFNQRSHNLNSK